jgi:hypothetical protein
MSVETTGFGMLCLRKSASAHALIVAHFNKYANEKAYTVAAGP